MSNKNFSKEYLNTLVERLVALGESKDELSLWFDLYDAIEITEQEKLITNLEEELEKLEKLK